MKRDIQRVLALVPPSPQGKIIRDLAYGCWCGGERVARANLPPTSLLLVCTWLRKHGLHVELLDANEDGNGLKDICSRGLDFDAVLCLTSSLTFSADVAVLEGLKEVRPEITVIIYGSHPTFLPREAMSAHPVDFALLGYPEHTLVELLQALRAGRSLEGIAALCYRDNGRVRINRNLPRGRFGSLPIIEYDFLNGQLHYRNPLIQQYPYVTAVTSRGCSSDCVFCTAPAFAGHRVEAWPAQQVLEQIRSIVDQGYQEILFRDETFSAFRSRNREVLNGLLRLGIEVSWICNVKPGTTTLEDLKLMKLAGCRVVKVGVESGSNKVLRQSRKGISVDTTRRLMEDIHRVGLASHAHVMLGMPGDTPESIEETMRFVLDLEPTTVDVGICTPLPGSGLWNGLCVGQPEELDPLCIEAARLHTMSVPNHDYCDVEGTELEKSVRLFYRRFYLRPRYLWQRTRGANGIRGWFDIARSGLRVTRFMF